MRLLAATGRHHEALAAYQEFVRLLQRDDPRLLPDPELTALHRQIRDEARRNATLPSTPPIAAGITGITGPLTGITDANTTFPATSIPPGSCPRR